MGALVGSLLLHALLLTPLLTRAAKTRELAIESKDSYLRKLIQKDRARHLAVDISRRVAAAPPPPDPEGFVSETLTQELTQDLAQVTSGLLDVKLEKSLTDYVQASLEDELKEASKHIATGGLSKTEIKQLHRRFRQKAMDAAGEWREVHREEYQIEIAAKTVTEWYEERIASQVRAAVRTSLFGDRYRIWDRYFGNRDDAPGFVDDRQTRRFGMAHREFSTLAVGQFSVHHFGMHDRPKGLAECKKLSRNAVQLPGWPDKPSGTRAEIFSRLVATLGKGWEDNCDRYLRDYYPHEPKLAAEKKRRMSEVWRRLVARSKRYHERTEAGAPDGELQAEWAACRAELKAFDEAWGAVFVSGARQAAFRTINQAVRSRVLRGPFRDVAYRKMMDMLVAKLRPPVEQLAESQFREGMVLSEKGVHEAMKEFRVKALALLHRDMEQIITRPFLYRKLFYSHLNPYRNKVTGESGPPSEVQIRADEAALQKAVGKLPAAEKAYAQARADAITEEVTAAMSAAVDAMLQHILTKEGRLRREYYAQAETVDYADPFKQKLEARAMAWKGRRQDMADLTEQGVPDTSTPLIALTSGAGRGRVTLKPVVATLHPAYFNRGRGATGAVRWSRPTAPPAPAPWGFVTQATVRPPFHTPNFEAIPFLRNFPNLDGDLSDWGRVRPLVLRHDNVRDPALKTEPMLVYVAWNYQGFFFGYHVEQSAMKFSLPLQYRMGQDGVTLIKDHRISKYGKFVDGGDYFAVMFDTLDARLPFRGDPHAQEFYILPRGSATDPDLPGAERWFASRRYGKGYRKQWGILVCERTLFAPQPRSGPDGTGPYRVSKLGKDGYTVEAFLPRTIFKVPVFAPGWYVGFDCYVGTGKQPRGSGASLVGKGWAKRVRWPFFAGDNPSEWGDLLLLGTDARVVIQDAAEGWPRSTAIVPGHSYLITVVDPDRNVHLAGIDTVLVSAEVIGFAGNPKPKDLAGDIELYLLKETGQNTSVFQGYVDTQPGAGADVDGSLEMLAGNQVRFGYVDFADSRGRRNVVYEQKLPVIAPVFTLPDVDE